MRFQAMPQTRPLLLPRPPPHPKPRATTDVPTALSTTPASTSAMTSTSAPNPRTTATRSTRRAGTRSATTSARTFRASCSTVTTRFVMVLGRGSDCCLGISFTKQNIVFTQHRQQAPGKITLISKKYFSEAPIFGIAEDIAEFHCRQMETLVDKYYSYAPPVSAST